MPIVDDTCSESKKLLDRMTPGITAPLFHTTLALLSTSVPLTLLIRGLESAVIPTIVSSGVSP